MVIRVPGGVIHQIAGCNVCDKRWGHYKTAHRNAARHTTTTGHPTYVETGTTYSYRAIPNQPNKKEGSRS